MYKITDKDYAVVEREGEALYGVKLKSGTWKDVVVTYGGVSIKEQEEFDIATLSFHYNVKDPADFTIDELNEDESFKNYLGAVLQYIITDSLEYANQEGISIIGNNNESTTNSHTKSSSE